MDIDVSTKVIGAVVGKVCTKCGQWKELTQFAKGSYTRDGFQYHCKDCNRAYRQANRERILAANKAYVEANKDRHLAYWREYDERRKDKKAEYRKGRKAIMSEQSRQYHLAHAEEIRERKREYGQTDRGMAVNKARSARRRIRLLNAGGSFTAADIEAIRKAQGNRCYICGKKLKKYHIDHFIPLAKGGTNDPGNLRLACPACNLNKHAKHPHELGILI